MADTKTKASKTTKTGKTKKTDERKKYVGNPQNLINLADRPAEERRAIAQKSAEVRRKKKENRMALQECMRQLLNLPIHTASQKRVLKEFGFTDKDFKNKTILMVALFQKGLTGDVPAIREIINMMDKLQMFESAEKATGQNVTINVIPVGSNFEITAEDAELIKRAEAGEQSISLEEDPTESWDVEGMDEDSEEWEEWGNETYDP